MIMKERYTGQGENVTASRRKTGVLLVNLGTPEAPTVPALRQYLGEFLGDPRVIEYPRWLWWFILNGIILTLRPRHSAALYKRIWQTDGSPLRIHSEKLAQAVQTELQRQGYDDVTVMLAMRYGKPGVAEGMRALQAHDVGRVIVQPLYPQYSATTIGSVFDAVADSIKTLRFAPQLHLLGDYHDQPEYLDTLADHIRAYWQAHGQSERLIMSFHGIPVRYVKAGDPYALQCEATAKGLRQRLGLNETQAPMSYQSRFGREPWLEPYTDQTLRQMATKGVRSVDVICPGFAVDCLETLEEIAMQNRDFFIDAGGHTFQYIPALNAGKAHANMLCQRIKTQL